jgi:hypothetical protein
VRERVSVMVMRYDEDGGAVGCLWEVAPGQYERTVAMLTRIFGQPPVASGLASGEGLHAAVEASGFVVVEHDHR